MAKKVENEYLLTGISGLDELLGGGIIKNSNVILKGTPGSGKTTLAMQFLLEGKVNKGEPGLYLSTSQKYHDILKQFSTFDFDLEKHQEGGQLVIANFRSDARSHAFNPDPDSKKAAPKPKQLVEALEFALSGGTKYKRLVIDSISTLNYQFQSPVERRIELDSLLQFTKEKGLTTIFLIETPTSNSPFGFEEFLSDGLIQLSDIESANLDLTRAIRVLKQRGSKVKRELRPYHITTEGIFVYNEEII